MAARRPLRPHLNPIGVRALVWEAAMQSGALDLIDVPTFWRLSAFYNEVYRAMAYMEQLRELSESMLLPVAGASPDEFYDPKTGAVRPKYQWYFDGYRQLLQITTIAVQRGDSLVADLRRKD